MKTLLDLLGINPLRPNVAFGGDDSGGGGGGGSDDSGSSSSTPAATTEVPTFDTYYDAIDAGYDGIKYKRPYQYFDNDQKKFINTEAITKFLNPDFSQIYLNPSEVSNLN